MMTIKNDLADLGGVHHPPPARPVPVPVVDATRPTETGGRP
jgi:hypothetical protein